MLVQSHFGDPGRGRRVGEQKLSSFSGLTTYQAFPGHNLSLGLRADTEDPGLRADPHSLAAPPSRGGVGGSVIFKLAEKYNRVPSNTVEIEQITSITGFQYCGRVQD